MHYIRTAAALLVLIATEGRAAEPLVLMLADGDDGRAELSFQPEMTHADAFRLRTTRIGAPGSLITLSIDKAPDKLVSHVFTPEDCRFGDEGAICEITIDGDSRAFADLVAAFKAGRTAHLEVTNAGSATMRSDVSLKGFTRAFGNL